MPQAVVNIGLVGHVDHGKTTLTEALSGIWTDMHSEEIRRGISIRLGYADASFMRCSKCGRNSTKEKCPYCGAPTEFIRRVSFVDAPGHEMLMAIMLSGAAIMDGAMLVIAANEPCPQPQTKEHLMALKIVGVHRVVVVQNKIELVSREKVIQNYEQIKEFLASSGMVDAPVIPVSAIHRANLDKLVETLENQIPTPKRDFSAPARMYVARSFDVNRPGTQPERLVGGVIGGLLLRGRLRAGDEIEIKPGVQVKAEWQPIRTRIVDLQAGGEFIEEAVPGGLIGIGTSLDPTLTKADRMMGSVAGAVGELPPILDELALEVHLLERVVGLAEELEVKPLVTGEPLMINVGTATTVGTIITARRDKAEIKLKLPVCADPGARAAISRRVGGRWRLIGYGIIS